MTTWKLTRRRRAIEESRTPIDFLTPSAPRGMQRDVEDFHRRFGLRVGAFPHIRDARLRARLIAEEAAETIAALGFNAVVSLTDAEQRSVFSTAKGAAPSLVEFADGIADLVYVALGAAVSAGIDIGPVFAEVHLANMRKTGGGVDGDGKIRKPEGWIGPDVGGVIAAQVIARQEFATIEETGPGATLRMPRVEGCEEECCR